MADPTPFEITRQDKLQIATNGETVITCMDEDGRLFRRRAVRGFGTDQAKKVEWAVVELGGVRVYFDGKNVVVTRQDLQP
jgi:hypothetical protein